MGIDDGFGGDRRRIPPSRDTGSGPSHDWNREQGESLHPRVFAGTISEKLNFANNLLAVEDEADDRMGGLVVGQQLGPLRSHSGQGPGRRHEIGRFGGMRRNKFGHGILLVLG